MSSWRECKLGDVVESANTGLDAIKRAPIVDIDTGIKCLRIQDVSQSKKFINWGFTQVNEKDYSKFQLKQNDIIIARTGASIGVKKFISEDMKAVFNNGLIRLRANSEVYPKYLFYNFLSTEYDGFIESISGGTSTQPNMQIGALLSFDILLPPLEEQKAIAEVLSSLDDKIDLLVSQNQTLESLAQTLFRQWFIEEAKEEWEVGTFGDLVEVSSGKSLKRELFDDTGKYEVLGANGKIGKTNEWFFEEELIYTGRVGTLGNVFLIDEAKKVWLSDNTLVIKPKKYFYFIYFLMIDFQLENLNVGSTQPLVRQSDLKNIEILLPDDEIVLRFEQQSKDIFKKIKQNKKQIQTLENLRDTFLPKLLSGEVGVKK
ncbi:MAG TPA: restriction endonuclease subunit S [Sulfurospirillum sp. UBA11407]|nr:MAG TPA: restriction endonuclease subunit S [Sulfurospirillum sp. UBA11407]